MASIGDTTRPAFAYDQATDTWVPVGVGPHSHTPAAIGAISNSLTTTTGDLIYAASANTPARLGIGSTGQILTVSGGVPAWGAAPSSGGYTQLATGSMSGVATVTISSINQTYKDLVLVLNGYKGASNTDLQVRINGSSSAVYGDLSAAVNQTYPNGYWQMGATVGTDSTNNVSMTFPNYSTSSTYKYVNFNGVFKSNTNFQSYGQWIAGSTITDAITSITFFTGSINWNAGTYTLWGVK